MLNLVPVGHCARNLLRKPRDWIPLICWAYVAEPAGNLAGHWLLFSLVSRCLVFRFSFPNLRQLRWNMRNEIFDVDTTCLFFFATYSRVLGYFLKETPTKRVLLKPLSLSFEFNASLFIRGCALFSRFEFRVSAMLQISRITCVVMRKAK